MDSLKEKVSRVASDYAQPALVEEFLCGREFTVALLGNHPDITVLPIVEINYSSFPEGASPIYSYEAKWVFDRRDAPLDVFVCPADIPETLAGEIRDIARRAFLALDVRDWCRIDVRLDSEGNPNVLELNPLPGILPDPKDNSCFPKAARAAGIEFAALVRRVVAIALRRCEQGVNPHGHR
jgi:D-alanine-D-alanine ligase